MRQSIIKLYLWDPASGTAKNAGNDSNNNASYKDQYDREALFKVVSLASDGVMPAADISRLINELRLSPQFKKRFLAFVTVLSAPQDPRASQSGSSYLHQSSDTAGGRDPLQMLDALEQVAGRGYLPLLSLFYSNICSIISENDFIL